MDGGSCIILVGPMGAGKSTVGRALAELLQYEFVDSDEEIERRTGANVSWIFEIEGENGFRDREQQVIAELVERERVVIATGGGAVMRDANREVLRSKGLVVYLYASLREQVRRTGNSQKRPLLTGKNRKSVLSELMRIRDPLYREVSDLVMPTDNRGAKKLAQHLLAQILSESPEVSSPK